MITFVKRYRSELLLCAFVAQILVSPLADDRPHVGSVLAFILLLLLLAGTSYMASLRIVWLVVTPVAALWLLARLLEAFGDSRHFYTHLAPIAGLALSVAVLWGILARFGSIPLITTSVISEAFISYLVIATAFGQIYWILNRFLADPFNQFVPATHISTLLYFSMVTLSTLGYGGIAPVNPYVRLVAAMEGMIGVFYIAVVVARLVASYRPRGHRNHTSHDSGDAGPGLAPQEMEAGNTPGQ